ncbi:hypothetical protein ACXYTJ_07465 [Gilvimarinus sp. F26214L]|uniref:hypothetical protein n=1 Tax=Gilvimarinus sp. DZF01 TaxID=3461371 RepID=UPI0040466565
MTHSTALHGLRLAILSGCLLLGACTHTLIVEGDFPSPLVGEMPITLGVHYPEGFSDYRYVEQSEDRAKWIIDMGEAQTEMFSAVLPGMVDQVRVLNGIPAGEAGRPGVDLIIQPSMAELQYTLPSETKVKVYEIWLKYNVQVFDPQGTLIADWILTAYGKTPSGFMQSDEAALNQAVVVALRDAGANLSLNFGNIPEVRAWLAQR